jgi:hypothetical protein
MRIRTLIFVVLIFAAIFSAAQATKRLILKDGSYQSVTKWEVNGDRVRYYSAERAAWEEMPSSLVDWKATEEWEKSAPAAKEQELKDAIAQDEAEATKEGEANPLVAPGVRLPDGGGVFLLDVYRNRPELAELVQTGSEINKQTGKNILRAAINPIATVKQSIEIKGAHARVQAHTPDPEIYLDIDMDTQSEALDISDRLRIVRLQQKKNSRVLGNLKVNIIGNVSQQGVYVKSRAEKFSGDWVKVVPLEPLTPGEYAVVEMLTPKEMNLYVWDFGVNPSAPENASAWKPAPPREIKTGTEESPILTPRPD